MPANNLTELYNFEGNIEAAFQTWFSDQSLTLEVGIGTDTLPDNCISFQFLLGAATGHYALSAVNSKAEYDQFQFTIDVIIQTQRQTTEASQTAQVGTRHQELTLPFRKMDSAGCPDTAPAALETQTLPSLPGSTGGTSSDTWAA